LAVNGVGPESSTDAVTRFEHDHALSRADEGGGCSETGGASPDDNDVAFDGVHDA